MRWQGVIKELVTTYGFEYTYGPAIEYITSNFGKEVLDLLDEVSRDLEGVLIPEYVEELRGCADAARELGYGTLLPLETIITINLLYEFSNFCTSIVTEDGQGQIWHSRNMDWSFGKESLKNISIIADFQKGGVTQYKTITWAGYVGAISGMRPDGFSITIDERFTSDILAIIQSFERLLHHKGVSVGFLSRDVLDNNRTYEAAVKTLAYTPLTTSVYYIVGGTEHNEGCVITRKEEHVEVWEMPNGPQPWFIIETNYDHRYTPPYPDDRRKLAIEAIEAVGRANINATTLFHVMETPGRDGIRGVLNGETQYTVVMSAVQGYFRGYYWK